ncbi:MAG: hypothetical protein FWG85_00515 [Bacteroidetes bacterium]|nr:hypothetical protein [Bacteroidota bacterium]
MKKYFIYFLFLIYSNVLLSWPGGGSGETNDPYLIWDKYDLENLNDSLEYYVNYGSGWSYNKHFRLMVSIDNVNKMIAGDVFSGYFHGNGKKITVELENILGCALFVALDYGGIIDSLTVDGYINVLPGSVMGSTVAGGAGITTGISLNGGAIIHCVNNVIINLAFADQQILGGIVSDNYSNGTISQCINNVDISGIDVIGGIAGRNIGGTITNCINTGKITATNSGSNLAGTGVYTGGIGGVVGEFLNNGQILNCVNLGTIIGQRNVGGIVGYSWGSPYNTVEITNCINYGFVKGLYQVGGIVGIMSITNVTNCVNAGVVEGEEDTGSIVGKE